MNLPFGWVALLALTGVASAVMLSYYILKLGNEIEEYFADRTQGLVFVEALEHGPPRSPAKVFGGNGRQLPKLLRIPISPRPVRVVFEERHG